MSPEELEQRRSEAREGARQLAAYAKARRRLYYLRYVAKKKGKPRPPLHPVSEGPFKLPDLNEVFVDGRPVLEDRI